MGYSSNGVKIVISLLVMTVMADTTSTLISSNYGICQKM